MSDRLPDEEAQVDATGDWTSGGAVDAAPGPSGEGLTPATVFAPGLVSEATIPRGAAATPGRGASGRAAVDPEDARGPAEG